MNQWFGDIFALVDFYSSFAPALPPPGRLPGLSNTQEALFLDPLLGLGAQSSGQCQTVEG